MMKRILYIISLLTVVIFLFCISSTVVTQGWMTIIMAFGKPVKVLDEPGLYLKLPYPFHKAYKIDGRLTLLQPRPAEFLTSDKKNLILENCVCYRITDPILFMKTVRDKQGLDVRLTDILTSHTGLLLGIHELSHLVNVDSTQIQFKALNDELTELMRKDGKEFGVEVQKVFIKRIMLPQQNKLAVYDRMRAERDRIAKKYLAEGEEIALEIRAEADKNARTIISEAERKAAAIKGEADAQAMKIYGDAYGRNKEFYSFIKALEAYESMFNDKTLIVLDEESPVLKELFSGGKIAGE